MFRFTAIVTLLAVALPGCVESERAAPPAASAGAAPVSAVDDIGRRITLPRPASRIISLLPATTETLVALGAGDRLVGRTDYDDPELDHLPSVGGGLTPSLEAIAALRPDLVIAWEESGESRIRPRLESLGIPVLAVQTRDTADIFANIGRLAALTGLDARGDSLAAGVRRELEAIRRSVADRHHPSAVYIVGLDPPIVAGPNLFIGEILTLAGARNVFPELEAASPQISMEEILRRRPEVVLIPGSGEGALPAERLAGEPGWGELARSGTRMVAVPADVLHRPGPGIAEGARIIRDALHPELAESDDAP